MFAVLNFGASLTLAQAGHQPAEQQAGRRGGDQGGEQGMTKVLQPAQIKIRGDIHADDSDQLPG